MPPRFKSGLALACMLLAVYVIFWRDESPFEAAEHPIEVFPNNFGDPNRALETAGIGHLHELERPAAPENPQPTAQRLPTWVPPRVGTKSKSPVATTSQSTQARIQTAGSKVQSEVELATPGTAKTKLKSAKPETNTQSARPTKAALPSEKSPLDKQFTKEYEALEEKQGFGEIYGQTLKVLVDVDNHKDPSLKVISTDFGAWEDYTPITPFKYNPYPDYNSETWKSRNQGEYIACKGPNGSIEDLVVWAGHPPSLSEAALGSWQPLNVNSNLCFERETRLGPYGFISKDSKASSLVKRTDYENVDWGHLQQHCVDANSDRFPIRKVQKQDTAPQSISGSGNITQHNGTQREKLVERVESEDETESESSVDSTKKVKPAGERTSSDNQDLATKEQLSEAAVSSVPSKKRTAVVIRSHSGQEYTENDKQNIRSLISELCLRSGGEYQVFLLIQIKEDLPIWTDLAAYQKALKDNVPKEFRSMAVLWSEAQMKEMYPLIPDEVNNAKQSQWLPMQKFVKDRPEFDFYWNWEFDTRFTGHHYDLFEKVSIWSRSQFRQGLWERNERFYIPSAHSSYMKFLETIRHKVGNNIIWGPVRIPKVTPSGPAPPADDPKMDNYKWGIGDDADFISLAPMFDPVNTTWPGRNDVWGYAGEDTPRRATIGGNSRCSRKLLERMHIENIKGNHLNSEMEPPTVALLHGFKAVFAPIPFFFDRAWVGKSLRKYFNPGRYDVCGSTGESPFSEGKETRFRGSTWYYGGETSTRIWNNWLGLEDNEIGGPEWEKSHGRACLPPMLLLHSQDSTIPVDTPKSKLADE